MSRFVLLVSFLAVECTWILRVLNMLAKNAPKRVQELVDLGTSGVQVQNNISQLYSILQAFQ